MPPLNTYCQTIPKYSWSSASLNAPRNCGRCTFYDYDKSLRWGGRTKAQSTEKNQVLSSTCHGAKSSEAEAFRESFMAAGLEGFGQVKGRSSVGTQIGVRIVCVASAGHVNPVPAS